MITTNALNVCIIHDDKSQRTAIASALGAAGFSVLEAGRVAELLDSVQPAPSVILVASTLPEMDGAELCRRLKADPATAGIAVILFPGESGHPDPADDAIADPACARELVSKVRLWARLTRAEAELKARTAELECTKRELHQEIRTRQAVAAEYERALQRVEQELQSTLDVASAAVLVLDATGYIVRASAATWETFRCRPTTQAAELLRGCTLYRPDGTPLPAEESPLKLALAGEAVGERMMQIRFQDGTESTIVFCATPSRDKSGGLSRVVVLFKIITEYRNAVDELGRAAERFRVMGEVLPYGVWWCNERGQAEYVSQSFLDLLGMSMEQVRRAGWRRRLAPDDAEPALKKWRRCIMSGAEWDTEYRVLGQDGSYHAVLSRGKPVRDAAGRIVGWAGINLDIDAREQAEEALRQSEARFRATVENIPEMVWVAGQGGGYEYLSPSWLQYTGTSELENSDGGWINVIHPADRAQALERWSVAVATGSSYETEYRLRRADGEYRWHSVRARSMEFGTDRPLWFGTVTDIHDQKLTQELLVRSEKVAALGRMAATLAHDINNPLAAAMNTLYLARGGEGLPELTKQYLDTTDAELQRIAHISRQALGFYREHSTPVPVPVEAILDEAVALFRSRIKSKCVRIDRRYESRWRVMATAGELRQVFCNLIANSLDVIAEKGVIKLRVMGGLHPKTGAPCVRITVADSGTGIASGSMSQLFQPLFTTKGSVGTGLGLWVSKQLIEKHAGSVRVRSCTEGSRHGTTFSILLPAHAGARVGDARVGGQ